jgi:thioredoxin reductase (NADPH)
MTGYHPDVRLLEKCGIIYNPESLESKVNEPLLESNIPGLFVAGSLVAGRNANRIFIENAREHGEHIVSAIKRR